jgi:hypothetical protein
MYEAGYSGIYYDPDAPALMRQTAIETCGVATTDEAALAEAKRMAAELDAEERSET